MRRPDHTERRSFAVRASLIAYRWLMYAYPRGFRARFGAAMAEDCEALLRDRRGLLHGWRLLLRDFAVSVPREWWRARATRGNAQGGGKVTVMLETWTRDFKHAARSLVRAPVFALVVVVTLALAIGANTAIFSVVSVVLLEPLPFSNADRLVHVGGTAPGTGQPEEFGVPEELYFEYSESVPALENLGLYYVITSTTRAEGHTEQLFRAQVTPSVFTTLGARPHLGRLPTEQDGDRVVVLSHWLWQTWFGADPDVVGRSYHFAGETRTVIGVMGPKFRFPDERVAFWVPLWPARFRAEQSRPGGFEWRMVARVAPGTDRARLVAQLAPLAGRVQERLGGSAPYAQIMQHYRPVVRPLREQLVGNKAATALSILLGTVGVVFLIACANVANLFTIRAESRRRDLAVRAALGAGRGGLVRSQMAEALLLAAAGGAGGALIAWAGVPLLVQIGRAHV